MEVGRGVRRPWPAIGRVWTAGWRAGPACAKATGLRCKNIHIYQANSTHPHISVSERGAWLSGSRAGLHRPSRAGAHSTSVVNVLDLLLSPRQQGHEMERYSEVASTTKVAKLHELSVVHR